MIAVAWVATGVGVDRTRTESTYAVTASDVRRSAEGMKASTTKAASGMKATATMETAAPAPMETAATTTVEAAAATTMEAAAPAPARLGYVCER
jgi:hypothetical protein